MAGEVELAVGMDYPGKRISVNHCYRHAGGKKYLHREARAWRRELARGMELMAYAAGLRGVPLARPIVVRIDARYTDAAHATDVDNLMKLAWDAVKVALGVDDRHFQPERGTVEYGAAIPSVTVTAIVRRADGNAAPQVRAEGGVPEERGGRDGGASRRRDPRRSAPTPPV